MTEPIDAAAEVADAASPDPVEMLMRQEAVKTAVSRFAELPTLQRSVVILKDVLDESLMEIAALLDLTVDAVKAHLARGRARLREINAHGRHACRTRGRRPPRWRAMSRCSTSGTGTACGRCWPTTSNSISRRTRFASARADVGMFFTIYAKFDGVSLAPAWLEGREVIAVFENRADPKPSYMMWLEWRDGQISFHPRLPLCALCRRRRGTGAGAGCGIGGRGRRGLTVLAAG